MRVLLIDPPFYRLIGYFNRYYPLGLAYLASVLRKEGHDVLIYDADCNINPSKMDFSILELSYPIYLDCLRDENNIVWKELQSILQAFSPDIVGITVWTSFAASAFRVAQICKEYKINLPVIMGGPHITIKADEVLKICTDVDFLIKGEGENTFSILLNLLDKSIRLNDNEISDPDNLLRMIKGISYRKNGEVIHQPLEEFVDDLDTIPFPARDLLVNHALYDSEDMGLLMTSRGCPYSCTYCATSIWGKKVRNRSVYNVIQEIKQITETYGTKQFAFKDDSFTINRHRVIELCNRIKQEKIKINWDCNTRVDCIDEELLDNMKEAGCNGIKVGIETGSERIMRLINKNTTLEECMNAAKLLKKAGIHWTGYFMIGLPTETKDDMQKTLEFMRKLEPDFASISVYEPFPGTAMFDLGIEKGLAKKESSLSDFFEISPKYYYIKDMNRRIDTMSNQEFKDLESEIKEAFHKYNMGIPRLAKRLKSRRRLYIREPKTIWSDFKKFLGWL